MTPKAKAEELVKKMDIIHHEKLGKYSIPVSMHSDQMVKCAIIAVEEILALYKREWNIDNSYWKEVLTELNSMK